MENPEERFNAVKSRFAKMNGVIEGNMMSSPGLKYNDKVFAFFYKEKMGFRLGPSFDPEKMGLKNPQPLSPFKTKPPLKGWFLVGQDETDLWEPLTEMALEFTQTLR